MYKIIIYAKKDEKTTEIELHIKHKNIEDAELLAKSIKNHFYLSKFDDEKSASVENWFYPTSWKKYFVVNRKYNVEKMETKRWIKSDEISFRIYTDLK